MVAAVCAAIVAPLLYGADVVAATCESLSGLALPNTTITIAAIVPAGTFDPPGRPAGCLRGG